MPNMLLILPEIIHLDTPISTDKPIWYSNGPHGMLHANKECWANRRITTTIETIRDISIKKAWTNHKVCKECVDRVTLPSANHDKMFQQAVALSRIEERIQHIANPRWIHPYGNVSLLAAWRRKQMLERHQGDLLKKDLAGIQVFNDFQPWVTRMENEIRAFTATPINREALEAEILWNAAREYMYYTLYVDSGEGSQWGKMREVALKWCQLLRKNYTPHQATENILAACKTRKPEATTARIQQNMIRWEQAFEILTAKSAPVLIGISQGCTHTAVRREDIQEMASSNDLEMVLCSALHRVFAGGRHIVMCHPTIWKYFLATGTAGHGEMKHHSGPIHLTRSMTTGEIEVVLDLWEPNDSEAVYWRFEDAYKAMTLL